MPRKAQPPHPLPPTGPWRPVIMWENAWLEWFDQQDKGPNYIDEETFIETKRAEGMTDDEIRTEWRTQQKVNASIKEAMKDTYRDQNPRPASPPLSPPPQAQNP